MLKNASFAGVNRAVVGGFVDLNLAGGKAHFGQTLIEIAAEILGGGAEGEEDQTKILLLKGLDGGLLQGALLHQQGMVKFVRQGIQGGFQIPKVQEHAGFGTGGDQTVAGELDHNAPTVAVDVFTFSVVAL